MNKTGAQSERAAQTFSTNVILVDADHVDDVVLNLTANFERMLNRRLPKADLPRWLNCLALDGGLRPGNNAIQVIFLHKKENQALKHFVPAHYANDLDGKAFTDSLGEFTLHSAAVPELSSSEEMFLHTLNELLKSATTERLMIVGDMDSEETAAAIKRCIAQAPQQKSITLFAMEPVAGRGFMQEILGYSLMNALGIKGSEFA